MNISSAAIFVVGAIGSCHLAQEANYQGGFFVRKVVNTTDDSLAARIHEADNRVQFGVSYKFDLGPSVPVVARY